MGRSDTLTQTVERLTSTGSRVRLLPAKHDVDDLRSIEEVVSSGEHRHSHLLDVVFSDVVRDFETSAGSD